MMEELRSEFSAAPAEISHANADRQKNKKELAERTKVEEDNFIRLGGERKLNRKNKRIDSGMDSLTSFTSLRGLESSRSQSSKSMREQMDDVKRKRSKKKR